MNVRPSMASRCHWVSIGFAEDWGWRQVYLERKRNLEQETTKFTADFQQNYFPHINNKLINKSSVDMSQTNYKDTILLTHFNMN